MLQSASERHESLVHIGMHVVLRGVPPLKAMVDMLLSAKSMPTAKVRRFFVSCSVCTRAITASDMSSSQVSWPSETSTMPRWPGLVSVSR